MSTESNAGRPSKYKPEYTEELLEYFSDHPYSVKTKRVAVGDGEFATVDQEVPNDFPTLAGFAIKIGVHRDTLHEWSECGHYPEFSDAYKRVKDFQERYLLVNGLKGIINSAFGIFAMKNILKWRDKQPDEGPEVSNTQVMITIPSNGREAKEK